MNCPAGGTDCAMRIPAALRHHPLRGGHVRVRSRDVSGEGAPADRRAGHQRDELHTVAGQGTAAGEDTGRTFTTGLGAELKKNSDNYAPWSTN